MFDWWQPAKLAHAFPLIGRIARLVGFNQPDIEKTTEQGAAGTAAPAVFQMTLQAQRYERQAVIHDIRQLLKDDPRLARASRKFARKATRRGVIVTVDPRGDGNEAEAKRAQAIIEQINADARINDKLSGWAQMLMAEGDLFLQNVAMGDRLINIKRMPAASMERNTDETDSFPDPAMAFTQFDVTVQTDIAHFARWQITHARWNHVDGERYGESEFLQVRNHSRLLGLTEQGQVVRRMTRAPQRRVHHVGTPDKPAPPIGPGSIEEYKRVNGLISKPRDAWDPMTTTTDYFGNGLTKIETLPGDPNVHEIDDIKHLQDVQMAGAGTPKAVVGLDAENINRDILKDQRAEWHDDVNLLAEALADALYECYTIGLLLARINPDSLVIKVRIASASMETAEDRMTRVTKARQNTVGSGKAATPDPLISKKTAITILAEDLGIEDVEAELAALEEEIAAHQAETAPAAVPPEGEEPGEDEDEDIVDGVRDLDDRVDAPDQVVVVVVCVSDPQGRVLLVRRSPGETRAGEWEVPGGHVDAGETLEAAAVREVKEETGLDVVLGPGLVEFDLREGGRGVMVRGFWVGGQLDLKLDEHDLFQWVFPCDVAQFNPSPPRLFTNIRTIMRAPVNPSGPSAGVPTCDSRRRRPVATISRLRAR